VRDNTYRIRESAVAFPTADFATIIRMKHVKANEKSAKSQPDVTGDSGVNLLDKLDDAEAAAVLHKLLDRHRDLRIEAEAVARDVLAGISAFSVADEIEDALLQFDYDDLNGRAGKQSWGYVEPSEAAGELLEEALEPFIDDMKRYLEAGQEEPACQFCQGILLGLYRVRDSENDLLSWAPDFPGEAASDALKVWRETGGSNHGGDPASKRRRLSPDFVREHVPAWDWLVKRGL
jgi:hypothetical protein